MRNSDLAIIFFSLCLILFSLYLYAGSLDERLSLMEQYRFDYESLCPDPLFKPVVSFSTFVAVLESNHSFSALEYKYLFSCVSFDQQIIR